jgi:hypothetical protein
MHPKALWGLWGVTLPTFHEPEGRANRRELKSETSNNQYPTPNIQWPGWRIGRWMLDVYLAFPLVDEFYKNQMADFRPAAGGDTAKILRKARWVGR